MSEPINVLFIEDNPGDARLVQEALRLAGAKTSIRLEWVERLGKGLERLTSDHIQAVLLDLNLPDSAGLDTLHRVLDSAPSIPVIVMTGHADEVVAMQAVQAGAQDYLIKGQADGRLLTRSIQYAIQRKQAEEALRQSQERISGMIASAMDAIITIDQGQRIILFNPAAEQMFGYSAADVMGRPVDILLPERVRSIHHEHVRIFGETGMTSRAMGALGTLSGLRANGEEFPIEASISQLESGGQKFYTVILRDITERKQAEEALRESEQKYSVIFDKSPFAITLTKMPEATIVGANDAFLELFEFTREEVIGKTSVELGIADAESRAQVAAELQARGRVRDFEVARLTKSGRRLDFALNLDWVTIRDEKYILTTIRDITERKQAEDALRAKNEEVKNMSQQLWQAAKLATMGELAASIAHELNNPLATVSLRAEMLQARFSPEDPESRSLQIIDSEIKRMSSLVANLLQFSRRSASQISTIDVNEELINALDLIHYHLRKNNILTVQELSPGTQLIQADRQQLRQVFLNLFTNAADAMPLGGTLTIRTWPGKQPETGVTSPPRRKVTGSLGLPVSNAPQVFIEVSDTGDGIPPEILEKVWEPFYSTKPEGKGTGLGLAICRRIVQEHGGSIEFTSDGIPGKGATVRVSFPALKES